MVVLLWLYFLQACKCNPDLRGDLGDDLVHQRASLVISKTFQGKKEDFKLVSVGILRKVFQR